VAQELLILPKVDEEAANLIESSARHDVHRVGGWKKSADIPLGEAVANAIKARESRTGRMKRARGASKLS
jgi:hypothetical protein